MPSDPLMTLASSVRMSPNMFSVTITSKWVGWRMICIAALSTNMKSSSTSGYWGASCWAISRQKREVSRTLVDYRQVTAAAHGQPERHVQHALDLLPRVGAGVHGPVAPFVAALRPSEIDAARQFADADEVGAPHHLGLERRAVGQRVEERDGAQVGEQSQRLAHAQQPLFGAYRRFGVVVVFGVADGANSTASASRQILCVSLRVDPRGVDGAGAHQRFAVGEVVRMAFRATGPAP